MNDLKGCSMWKYRTGKLLIGLTGLYAMAVQACGAGAAPTPTFNPAPRYEPQPTKTITFTPAPTSIKTAPSNTPTLIPTPTDIPTPTSTPTPTAVPTPIPSPTYTPTATPTKQPEDPLLVLIDSNSNLNYKLNPRTRQSMLKELRDSPYRIQLTGLIDRLSEAWNYKVRREDEVLCVIIPTYQKDFDCNSEEAWQFRFDDGSYQLKLWSDGNSILPLDNEEMAKQFPNKDDREFTYMNGLWVPPSMPELDLTKYNGSTDNFQTLRNNMDLILGTKKINNLPFADLRDRITSVDNDRLVKSYPWPDSWSTNDYEEAMFNWTRQTTRAPPGFTNTLSDYGKQFVPVLEKNWKDFQRIELAYGLGIVDMVNSNGDKAEQWDSAIAMLYTKALGAATFDLHARYPDYTKRDGDHQVLGISVSSQMLKLLPADRLVFKGQVIAPYSAINGLKVDYIPYVRGPTPNNEIVWRLN